MCKVCIFEKFLYRTISACLYVGCLAFVINRGYNCFAKYLSKPEGISESYHNIGDLPFPSFTFCPNNGNNHPPRFYNNYVTKKCNIDYHDYVQKSKYVGSGGKITFDIHRSSDLINPAM